LGYFYIVLDFGEYIFFFFEILFYFILFTFIKYGSLLRNPFEIQTILPESFSSSFGKDFWTKKNPINFKEFF